MTEGHQGWLYHVGKFKEHFNANSVILTIMSGLFAIVADVGIRKLDNNAVELAVVHATQNSVLTQLETIHREIDDKVSKEEFRSEIHRMESQDKAYKEEFQAEVRRLDAEIREIRAAHRP